MNIYQIYQIALRRRSWEGKCESVRSKLRTSFSTKSWAEVMWITLGAVWSCKLAARHHKAGLVRMPTKCRQERAGMPHLPPLALPNLESLDLQLAPAGPG
jgi:hypothetical protein